MVLNVLRNELPVVGRMTSAPEVLKAIVPEALTSSEITVMLLVEVSTAVPVFAPSVAEPKLFTMLKLREPVSKVMSPESANKFNTPPCVVK